MKNGFSRREWQDVYYDGEIGIGQGYDEDSGIVFSIPDYWGFKISKSELGYIEDFEDDWYLDMLHGKTQRKVGC